MQKKPFFLGIQNGPNDACKKTAHWSFTQGTCTNENTDTGQAKNIHQAHSQSCGRSQIGGYKMPRKKDTSRQSTRTPNAKYKRKWAPSSQPVLWQGASGKIQITKKSRQVDKAKKHEKNTKKNAHPAHNQSCGRVQIGRGQRRVFPEAASQLVSSCTWYVSSGTKTLKV